MPNPDWSRDLDYVWLCIIKNKSTNCSRPDVFEALAYCSTKRSTNV